MTEGKGYYPKSLLRKISGIVLVTLVIVTVISAGLNIYYYNSTRTLTNSVEGTTLEVAREFFFSMNYATLILDSQVTSDNVGDLVNALRYHLQTANGLLRALRIYLVPSYESQLHIIEDLLTNMTVSGYEGVGDTLYLLQYQGNVAVLIQAFHELNTTASQKINAIGLELEEAFDFLKRNDTVETFNVIPSRIENAVNASNDLKGILDEWLAKYSPP